MLKKKKIMFHFVFFFCSSRILHTSYNGDWSSDVCSSDLAWTPRRTAPPFWLGEAPGRTVELSDEVSRLRRDIAERLRGQPGQESQPEIGRASCRERV